MLGNPCCATFSLFGINFLFHCNKLPHRSGLKRNHLIFSQFCGSDVGRGTPWVQTEVKYGHVSLQRLRKESVPLLPAARGDPAFPASGPFSVFRASVHGPSSPPAAACVTHGSPCYLYGRQ